MPQIAPHSALIASRSRTAHIFSRRRSTSSLTGWLRTVNHPPITLTEPSSTPTPPQVFRLPNVTSVANQSAYRPSLPNYKLPKGGQNSPTFGIISALVKRPTFSVPKILETANQEVVGEDCELVEVTSGTWKTFIVNPVSVTTQSLPRVPPTVFTIVLT